MEGPRLHTRSTEDGEGPIFSRLPDRRRFVSARKEGRGRRTVHDFDANGQLTIDWPRSVRSKPPGTRQIASELSRKTEVNRSSGCSMQHRSSGQTTIGSPDGQKISCGPWGGEVKVWDAYHGEELFTLVGEVESAARIAFRPNGKQIAIKGEGNPALRLWNTDNGDLMHSITTGSDCRELAFSPDGRLVASSEDHGDVIISDVENKITVERLHGHTGLINAIAFDPNGKWLWTSGPGHGGDVFKGWDLTRVVHIATTIPNSLTGSTKKTSASRVAFTASGKRVITDINGSPAIWSVSKRDLELKLKGSRSASGFWGGLATLAQRANDLDSTLFRVTAHSLEGEIARRIHQFMDEAAIENKEGSEHTRED